MYACVCHVHVFVCVCACSQINGEYMENLTVFNKPT